MKILLTGATGYVGGRLLKAFEQRFGALPFANLRHEPGVEENEES